MLEESEGAVTETGVVDFLDEDQINSADDERVVGIAMDSGAVDHTTGPQHLPANTEVIPLQGEREWEETWWRQTVHLLRCTVNAASRWKPTTGCVQEPLQSRT